jgi:hypothetical protein
VLGRRLAGLDVNVDTGAVARTAVLDARDPAAERTEQLGQLRLDTDLRIGAQLERDVLGQAGREPADAHDMAAANPQREAELRDL